MLIFGQRSCFLESSQRVLRKNKISLSKGFRSTPAAHSDLSSRIYPSYDYMDNDFSAEAFKRNYNAKEFIKKSLADQKSLRFHQCYFNPISCFRR